MNRILTCPHCGPTLTEARLRCNRCGRDLVYVSELEFLGLGAEAEAGEQRPAAGRRVRLWAGVSAAVAVVIAMAGLAVPGTNAPPPAAPPPTTMRLPGAVPNSAAAFPSTAESARLDAPTTAFKPGDTGVALDRYRSALAEKPGDAELLANVGQILVAMDRHAEAVPFLEQAVQAEPFSIVARFDLAVAYGRSGQPKEAVEQYEALVRSGQADARVHHNLGLALRQLGRNTEAVAAFERATSLAPDKAPGWMGLALSLEADGRGGEAAVALERYLLLEPSGPDADNVRARISRLRSTAAPSAVAPGAGIGAERRGP
jgi:Flp pilus assembly protein TadD